MKSADFATIAPWSGIQGRPKAFPPEAHRHSPSDIDSGGAKVGEVLTWDGRKYVPQAISRRKIVEAVNDAFARFEESLTVVADGTKALVEKTTELEARFKGNEASFGERITALATATEASVTVARELIARVGDAEAGIRRTDTVMASRDSALARTTEEIFARVGANKANITTIKQSYATRTFAEAKKTEAITAATALTSAAITTALVGYATETFAEAKKTEAITAAAANTSASITTALVGYATTGFAEAKKSEAITAAAADATAKVLVESTARATADGNLSAQYVLRVSTGGRVAGMKVTSTTTPDAGDTSEIVFNADVFKIYDGSGDIAPFVVTGGIVYLTDVVVNQLAANISIQTPTFTGGQIKMQGTMTICSTTTDGSDTSILRMNGGGSDGPTRGGQVDVLGNEFGSSLGGSILLTPGNASDGTIRLRDRLGFDRLIITTGGTVDVGDLDATSIISSSYDTPSSRRLKSNVRTIAGSMELVRRIRGVRFDWKTKKLKNDIGFIAEEMAKVLPVVVRRGARGQVLGLDYTRIPAVLVEALKDVDRRLARVERRFAA